MKVFSQDNKKNFVTVKVQNEVHDQNIKIHLTNSLIAISISSKVDAPVDKNIGFFFLAIFLYSADKFRP